MAKKDRHIFAHVMGKDNPANYDSLKESADTCRTYDMPAADTGVVDAFYAHSPKPHSHHLQNADKEISYATWSMNDGVRTACQEDDNGDEVLKE
jgi:poly-D-alanine transfer protein DltD